jgi:hypothetical protein
LVADLIKVLGREKDEDFKTRFENWGLPRLWDYYQSKSKRQAKPSKSA